MADQAKITIRVSAGKTASTVRIATTGRYKGLQTAGITAELLGQPQYTTASAKLYWEAVLSAVQTYLATL